MADPRAWLDRVDARTNAATDGPWRIDRWEEIFSAEVTYSVTGDTSVADRVEDNRDAESIAHARTDLPAATTALRAVLDLHQEGDDGECTGCRAECLYCESEHDYPCPTVTAMTTALTKETDMTACTFCDETRDDLTTSAGTAACQDCRAEGEQDA